MSRIPRSAVVAALLVAAILISWSWQRARGGAEARFTAGLLIAGSRYADGWYSSTFDAATRAASRMGAELLTADNLHSDTQAMMNACDTMLRSGARLIMMAGAWDPRIMAGYMRDHSYVQFTGYDMSVSLRNYHPLRFRLYEAAYLLGAAAALRSRSGIAGFVAPDLGPESRRSINAFALGGRGVNPKFRVKAASVGTLSGEKAGNAAVDRLAKLGADVICYRQDEDFIPRHCESLGLDYVGFNTIAGATPHALAWSEFDFSTYYSEIFRAFSEGALKDPLWIGAEGGAFVLGRFSQKLGKKARKRLEDLYARLASGEETIFPSPLEDRDGWMHRASGPSFSDEELLNKMDFLVMGVEIADARD
ncbi:MAG: BMP family ABC transporter substrate-binding protein [Succinivibrio sp.]